MSRNILWLLLCLSGLFNVFFAAGYMQARARAAGTGSAERSAAQTGVTAQRVARALELDHDQAALFAQMQSASHEERAVFRGAMALARQELAEELGRDAPDVQRVRVIVERIADLERQHRLACGRRFGDFLKVLSPDQRRMLRRRMHAGRGGRGVPPWLLQRFDADGNGRLEGQERAEARAYVERRRECQRLSRPRGAERESPPRSGP